MAYRVRSLLTIYPFIIRRYSKGYRYFQMKGCIGYSIQKRPFSWYMTAHFPVPSHGRKDKGDFQGLCSKCTKPIHEGSAEWFHSLPKALLLIQPQWELAFNTWILRAINIQSIALMKCVLFTRKENLYMESKLSGFGVWGRAEFRMPLKFLVWIGSDGRWFSCTTL